MELWCCCLSQQRPIVKIFTVRSTVVWLQIVSVGLFHETFKCELVSRRVLFFATPVIIKRTKKRTENPSRARLSCIQHRISYNYFSGLYTLLRHSPLRHPLVSLSLLFSIALLPSSFFIPFHNFFLLLTPRSTFVSFQECIDVWSK